jgi:hypothetical protein
VAAGAWEGPSWKTAACECHEARLRSGGKPPQPPQGLPLERHQSGAAASTIEALMFALRRGGEALTNPNNQRRLSELSETQLHEVCARLQNFKPEIARRWTTDEIEVLATIWSGSHHG